MGVWGPVLRAAAHGSPSWVALGDIGPHGVVHQVACLGEKTQSRRAHNGVALV